jgi:hypothetical protein
MRNVVYGAAVVVVGLIAAGVIVRSYRISSATETAQVSTVKNSYAIERTIDVKAMPKQDILSEGEE